MNPRILLIALCAGCFFKPKQRVDDGGGPVSDTGVDDMPGLIDAPKPLLNNVVFVTKGVIDNDVIGSKKLRETADDLCKMEAPFSGTFFAWVGDNTMTPRADVEIGASAVTKGWVRLDGKPFTHTLSTLETNNEVLNPVGFFSDHTPITFDDPAPTKVLTEAMPTGAASIDSTCFMTPGSNGTMVIGDPIHTSVDWTDGIDDEPCGKYHVYCFQTDKSADLPITRPTKRIAVLSRVHNRATDYDPVEACNTDTLGIVSGASGWTPLIAKTNMTPVEYANIGQNEELQRLDGVPVTKTGMRQLISSINEDVDGNYTNDPIMVGSTDFATMSTMNCNDFVTHDGSIPADGLVASHLGFENHPLSMTCDSAVRYICVQN
ncbi:MAG: hypothetical protein QM831_06580 [Kofleriaceae bacterium]